MTTTIEFHHNTKKPEAEKNHSARSEHDALNRDHGKVRISLRSERTLISSVTTAYPSFIPVGYPLSPLATGGKIVKSYAMTLSEEQENFAKQAEGLAKRVGSDIEIEDYGKKNILARLFDRLFKSGKQFPSAVLPSKAVVDLEHMLGSKSVSLTAQATDPQDSSMSHPNSEILTASCVEC
jgi:hypothetical protein